jgi:hypothetical protein
LAKQEDLLQSQQAATMESRGSQLPLKLITAPLMVVVVDYHGRWQRPKLITVENSRDGNEMQRRKRKLELTRARNNPDKIWRKTIATEIEAKSQIFGQIH